jgi:dihydropyrimidine dehydrogenase (NAD+) subunit PreA
MGSAVGQEPKILQMIVEWVMEVAQKPVIVKLTPNISDITEPAMAARRGGADAIALINTIQSIVGVDIDQFAPYPIVDGKGTNGGYCGPAVKPIALNMVKNCAQHPDVRLPISGIGGIENWRDAVEHILLGASSVHGGHALRLWHHPRDDFRPGAVHGGQRLQHHLRLCGQGPAQRAALGAA